MGEWKVTGHGEFSEVLTGITQGKLQAQLDQRSGYVSPRFSQSFSPPGFGFVPSPSVMVQVKLQPKDVASSLCRGDPG